MVAEENTITQELYTQSSGTSDDVTMTDKERESTSLKIDRDLYKEFKMEALRRDMEISELLDHAMRLAINEDKKKK
jgi:hypothetical protein